MKNSRLFLWILLLVFTGGLVLFGFADDGQNKGSYNQKGQNRMKIQVGTHTLTATLANNSSVEALKQMLKNGPVTINMHDFGNMEKVGKLSKSLPRNDEQITTKPGDLILYQGNAFVIYYAPNSWNFTRLGRIDDVSQKELKEILGKGDVKVTLSLE